MTLRGLPFVRIYCDDILTFTKTKSEHLKALGTVFARIAKMGFKLAAEKCRLIHKSIEFLGCVLTGQHITPSQDKLAIIKEQQPPRSNHGSGSTIFCSIFVFALRIQSKQTSLIVHSLKHNQI